MTTRKICFDRLPPKHLAGPPGAFRAISPIGKLWPNGSTLRISFIGGTVAQHDIVKKYAPQWCNYANLKFVFGNDADADFRISFDSNDGAWSYIGNDCKGIPLNEATMNLGWQEEGVTLHEFGHAIGLAHEHQSPLGGLIWNEPVVLHDLAGPPNYWDAQMVRDNVLSKYSSNQINGTSFDKDSVMLYAFPAEWTLNGVSTHANEVLSVTDESFIASSKMYPAVLSNTVILPVTTKALKKDTLGAIGKAGEEDKYSFTVTTAGTHVMETSGSTDLVMSLSFQGKLIATDDDSGAGYNSRISKSLKPGIYELAIRHYNKTRGVGTYGVSVTRP
jgi:astacin (peptidase family M12A)